MPTVRLSHLPANVCDAELSWLIAFTRVVRLILSIGSSGSILSVGSAGSILSIGSAGSILSVASAGSLASVFSIGSAC